MMGGNALKFYETRRYGSTEYFALIKELDSVFKKLNFDAIPIKAYSEKESFGDLDLIVDSSKLSTDWLEKLKVELSLEDNQIFKNSNTVSIGYKNFQIDLIVTPHDEVQSSLNYFSYNDLGNLIGRLSHKLGLKYGHKGLSLVIRPNENNSHILDEIILDRSNKKLLDILGLDYQKFQTGSSTLEDIFKYVASSRFFDPDIFLLDNKNATSKVRDKKRHTYMAFLKWIEETKPKANYSFRNKSELYGYSIREPFYTEIILKIWPEVKEKVDKLISDYESEQAFKNVFSGAVVSDSTGLIGKELGVAISKINSLMTKEIKEFLTENPEKVQQFIRFVL